MVTRFLTLLVLIGTVSGAWAQSGPTQLEIDPDYSADRLVREVFATDRCETIFNVRPIGNNPNGIGYFSAPEDVMGFKRGVEPIVVVSKIGRVLGRKSVEPKYTL